MKRLARLPMLILLVLGPACTFGPTKPQARPRPVEVPPGHDHSVECGHFYEDGQWLHQHGHVHGPGCGHVYEDGRWVER